MSPLDLSSCGSGLRCIGVVLRILSAAACMFGLPRNWMTGWGTPPLHGCLPETYAAALSGAFQIDRLGHNKAMRALMAREARRQAHRLYLISHPQAVHAAQERFRRMRVGRVQALLQPVTVGLEIFTHALLVKRPFCRACVDPSSTKFEEIRLVPSVCSLYSPSLSLFRT